MGLGGGPTESDGYEWVRLPDLRPSDLWTAPAAESGTGSGLGKGNRGSGGAPAATDAAQVLVAALTAWLTRNPVWRPGAGLRVLLVDLDNLRADPVHWRARMAFVLALARQCDHPVLAGQEGAVARARPHLAEFATQARPVPDGSDLADHELLAAASALARVPAQLVVVSNDWIFADLAALGPLVVVSPGRAALSARLAEAADRVVDLAELEAAADALLPVTGAPAQPGRSARRTRVTLVARRRARSAGQVTASRPARRRQR